jgi:hypothetical protein
MTCPDRPDDRVAVILTVGDLRNLMAAAGILACSVGLAALVVTLVIETVTR